MHEAYSLRCWIGERMLTVTASGRVAIQMPQRSAECNGLIFRRIKTRLNEVEAEQQDSHELVRLVKSAGFFDNSTHD